FLASPKLDGLYVEDDGDGGLRAHARIGGAPLEFRAAPHGPASITDGKIAARYDLGTGALAEAAAVERARGPHVLSGAAFLTLRALVRGALDPRRVNPISSSVRARWPRFRAHARPRHAGASFRYARASFCYARASFRGAPAPARRRSPAWRGRRPTRCSTPIPTGSAAT